MINNKKEDIEIRRKFQEKFKEEAASLGALSVVSAVEVQVEISPDYNKVDAVTSTPTSVPTSLSPPVIVVSKGSCCILDIMDTNYLNL